MSTSTSTSTALRNARARVNDVDVVTSVQQSLRRLPPSARAPPPMGVYKITGIPLVRSMLVWGFLEMVAFAKAC